ncbi:MAG: enoyl-CoA hydratase [Limnohabitans sp.]
MSDILLLEQTEQGVATLTLNRPEVMNALSSALREALVDRLHQLANDPCVRVLILKGAGKAFCAGLDLAELSSHGLPPSGPHNDPVTALASMPCPTIAAVQGVAVTGGLELMLACDMVLASHSARFADTHVRMGVLPGWGLSQKLSRILGRSRAMELSMSGNFMGAEQAERWGLVNRLVPDDALQAQALALAQDIATAPREMTHAYKRLIDEGYQLPLGEALALERQRSQAWAKQLTAASLSGTSNAVKQRGRGQA